MRLLQLFTPHVFTDDDRALVLGPATGALESLFANKYTLLTTFRRDGSPVFTPVLTGFDGGRVYVRTERGSGKVKRLRREPGALASPCTGPGRPVGPPLRMRGRVLPANEAPRAERALATRHGLDRAFFELFFDVLRVDMCYLELVPDADWSQPADPR